MGICISIKNSKTQTIISQIDKNKKKEEEVNKEYVFAPDDTAIGHIPDDKQEYITKQAEKSVCKILINKKGKGSGFGTGFLCNIGEHFKIKALVTAYHVLGKEELNEGNEIKITFNNNKKTKIIKIDNSRQIYANINDDITIIEILKKDKLDNYEPLEIDESIYNNNMDLFNVYKDKIIYIIHYPEGNLVKFDKNIIINIDKNNDIYHLCSTLGGSSGAPILNLDTLKVIRIHLGYSNYEKNIFNNEIINKFEHLFNNENKIKCNFGKTIKDSINRFNKPNKIILTLKIDKYEINIKKYIL